MKNACTIFAILFVAQISYAQTKILDSTVDWSAQTLTVYLSDSLATSVTVKLGTTHGDESILNTSYTVGSNISIDDNMLVVSLSTITPAEYYVRIQVATSAGTQEMEFKTTN